MVMAAKKGPGPGGGVGGGKAEAEAASEVWCRRVRELGGCSQAGNRHCFECAQRGVTYVDITVGSFVCTTCSGLLRGLNPPHRVKSISMTTFTEPEVVFLQSRGNEVCRKIWLGLFDARTSLIPDSRDPQKVKEFLQEKYEKKRWYVPPDQVKGAACTKGGAPTPVQGSIPGGKPLRTLLGDPTPPLSDAASTSSQSVNQSQTRTVQARGSQPPPHSSAKKASTDLLADIGGDPFAAPPAAPAFAAFPTFGVQTPSHGGFANFDAFGSSPSSSAFGSLPPAGQAPFQTQPTPAASRMLTGSYSFAFHLHLLLPPPPLTPAFPILSPVVHREQPGDPIWHCAAGRCQPAHQPSGRGQLPGTRGGSWRGSRQHLRGDRPGSRTPVCPSRQLGTCIWSLHQSLHCPCRPAPAAFHQPIPAQWSGPRAQLWDEQCRAWLPPASATHRGLCQSLSPTTVPSTDLTDTEEWLFLRGLRILKVGAEATEPASWNLHQPLHDWIFTIYLQTSNHQSILVALCPVGALPCFLGLLCSLELR